MKSELTDPYIFLWKKEFEELVKELMWLISFKLNITFFNLKSYFLEIKYNFIIKYIIIITIQQPIKPHWYVNKPNLIKHRERDLYMYL